MESSPNQIEENHPLNLEPVFEFKERKPNRKKKNKVVGKKRKFTSKEVDKFFEEESNLKIEKIETHGGNFKKQQGNDKNK